MQQSNVIYAVMEYNISIQSSELVKLGFFWFPILTDVYT